MKSRLIKVLIALLVALALAGGSYWQLNFNKDWREQYAYAKGVDALIYAFPYFLNTVLRYKWSQPEAPEGQQVPVDAVNKFWHATFVDPKNYRDGGAPNADTLYSPAWLYAKEQPIIITVPEIPGNRYFAIELAGFDSDNFAYISKRLHGNGGGNYAIVPPNWQGDLPENVQFVAHNPTPWFYAMARIYADFNDPSDQAEVAAIQSKMQIVGLSDWGKKNPPRPAHPPVPDVGNLSEVLLETNVVSYIRRMVMSDPISFWNNVNRAMTVNGIPERDKRYLKDWAELHIGPDQDVSRAEDNEQAGLAKAVFDGIMIMRAHATPEEKRLTVGVCHRRASGAPAFTVIFIFAAPFSRCGASSPMMQKKPCIWPGIKTRTATALLASMLTNSTFPRDKLRQQNISGRSQFTTGTPI